MDAFTKLRSLSWSPWNGSWELLWPLGRSVVPTHWGLGYCQRGEGFAGYGVTFRRSKSPWNTEANLGPDHPAGSLLYVRSVIVTVVYTCSASAVAAAIQEPFALIALSAWRRPMAKKSTRGSFSSTGSVSRQGYVLGRHKRR